MSIVYLAPLEGVTDAVFRQTHHACFGGVSKYFIPFVSPTQNLVFTSRDLSAVAPEHNIGVPAVPQLLAKDAALFNWRRRAAEAGYSEVNLNLGCPSGTVTAKGKGSGLLADYSPHLNAFWTAFLAMPRSRFPSRRARLQQRGRIRASACTFFALSRP